MNVFAKALAALSLAAFLTTPVLAQTPPPGKPVPSAKAPVAVKGYTRTTKSGKKIAVKGYTRGAKPAAAGMAVKGYTRTTKSGKKIAVKGYTRKTAAPKAAPHM